MTKSISEQKPHTLFGVPGTLHRHTMGNSRGNAGLWDSQYWVSDPVTAEFDGYGKRYFQVKVRFDDSCKNGHNSLGVTASFGRGKEPEKMQNPDCCGCLHDDVLRIFPALERLVDFHLAGTDGPMHYIENTTYLAGDLDCQGMKKGEPWKFRTNLMVDGGEVFELKKPFDAFIEGIVREKGIQGLNDLSVKAIPMKGKEDQENLANYSVSGYDTDWMGAPFKSRETAEGFVNALNDCKSAEIAQVPYLFGEGKERELDAARRSAIWPEATDEQLMLPKVELAELLEKRLPALVSEFQSLIEQTGLSWDARVELGKAPEGGLFEPA